MFIVDACIMSAKQSRFGYVLEVIQNLILYLLTLLSHLKINDLPGSTFDKFRIITNLLIALVKALLL